MKSHLLAAAARFCPAARDVTSGLAGREPNARRAQPPPTLSARGGISSRARRDGVMLHGYAHEHTCGAAIAEMMRRARSSAGLERLRKIAKPDGGTQETMEQGHPRASALERLRPREDRGHD